MKLPNFIIIGAPKSGTTSLYHYLKQHPQIYMSPNKEPKFFTMEGETNHFTGPERGVQHIIRTSITSIERYSALFQRVSNETAIGEASPMYLHRPKAAARIRYYLPDAKLIAILRNPVDRIYSDFLHQLRMGWEPITDMAHALLAEERRTSKNWGPYWQYKYKGFYYIHLMRYYNLFEERQIKILLYEDLVNNDKDTLKGIFDFLGVDTSFEDDLTVRHMVGSPIPRSKKLETLINKPNPTRSLFVRVLPIDVRRKIKQSLKNWNIRKIDFTTELRKELTLLYRDDILRLQDLIERDLSKWLM